MQKGDFGGIAPIGSAPVVTSSLSAIPTAVLGGQTEKIGGVLKNLHGSLRICLRPSYPKILGTPLDVSLQQLLNLQNLRLQ